MKEFKLGLKGGGEWWEEVPAKGGQVISRLCSSDAERGRK